MCKLVAGSLVVLTVYFILALAYDTKYDRKHEENTSSTQEIQEEKHNNNNNINKIENSDKLFSIKATNIYVYSNSAVTLYRIYVSESAQ